MRSGIRTIRFVGNVQNVGWQKSCRRPGWIIVDMKMQQTACEAHTARQNHQIARFHDRVSGCPSRAKPKRMMQMR